MVKGKCAKQVVICTIVTPENERFVGENWCGDPQGVCPRRGNEGYKKCRDICKQYGHAEIMALQAAGIKARGSHAYIEGHIHSCMGCQHELFTAGVLTVTVGPPEDFS